MEECRWPLCDICGLAVPKSNGRLLLKEDEVTKYWDYQISNEQKETAPNQGNGLKGDDTVPWHWGHDGCLPDSRYMIVAKKFENIRTLLDWTLYPPVDDLVGRTNWRETAQRFGEDAVARGT